MGIRRSPKAKRHADDDASIDLVPRPVACRSNDMQNGHIVARHYHARTQLLYGAKGVLTVETPDGFWVVPPLRAIWIPAYIDHEVTARGYVSMRSLYFDPEYVSDLPRECCVVTISPLMREMIQRAVSLPPLYDEYGPDGRFMTVLLDQVQALPTTPLHLPISDHPKLKHIADNLAIDPSDPRNLDDWANETGSSARTLTRLFQKETGLSFRQWRQQVRLLEALTRLAADTPVTTVALDLGYESQSAFIAMFKKAFGKTPGKYFSD